LHQYNLPFISDKDLYLHVKETVEKYRFSINLKEFNKNLVDPIKLTFDSKVYGKTVEEMIENESIRQIDKSNTNHIGYFHQNIFNYIGGGWDVPKQGYDIVNIDKNIFIEMKNKHNTMNSSSSQKTYMRMQSEILTNDQAVCYLVEVIAVKSQNIPWTISLNGNQLAHKNIRRISVDRFYEMVTGISTAFKDLCSILPVVISDVLEDKKSTILNNSVFSELKELSPDLLNSIYLLSFEKYEGFAEFKLK